MEHAAAAAQQGLSCSSGSSTISNTSCMHARPVHAETIAVVGFCY
jgi:hypothetical protein